MPAPIRDTQFSSQFTNFNNNGFQPDQVLHKATDYANSGAAAVKQVLDRYPPLKAFAYAFFASAALPTTVFAAISGSTFLGALAMTGTGVAVFQGIVIAITGFILFWFLLASLFIGGFFAFWATVFLFGVQMAKAVASRAENK